VDLVLLADVAMAPGGLIVWLIVGLISGWLAGSVMRGGGFGIIGDIVMGLIGAVIGGFIVGYFVEGTAGFWGSILVSFIGACLLIALVRTLSPTRTF
jgi:uncharacterized membrane protein YeaQ/YmgE (transglycosylase-associated protein family)